MRKRSKYRPRPVNPQAHLVAIQGAAWLSTDDQLRWAQDLDAAVLAVARGQATQGDWDVIFDAVNLIEQLVRMRRGRDEGGLVQAAQQACVDILDRQRATSTLAVRATELAALQDLVAGLATLLSGITQAERFQAGEQVARRVHHALAGGIPGARLIEAPSEIHLKSI